MRQATAGFNRRSIFTHGLRTGRRIPALIKGDCLGFGWTFDGLFRLTREGDTSSSLTVIYTLVMGQKSSTIATLTV